MFKLKTLHGYISRDLARVTGLALVAFTLVMTVFAIIEPLRKRGLATAQVAMLFGYTLPIMLSLTLPFAALFATAIVYGRFAQDRELLACRASGVSTVTLLKPAVLLGVIVTIVSLVLTNFVSPQMAKKGEQAVVKNIKGIAYHKIKKESHISLGRKYIIHASHVDEKEDALIGVVAGQHGWRRDPRSNGLIQSLNVLVASKAYMDTFRDKSTGSHFASVTLYNPVGPISNKIGGMVDLQEVPLQNIEIETPAKDKPAFYDWEQLIATLKDPTRHGEIKKTMRGFQRLIRQNRVLQSMKKSIDAGKPYTGFQTSSQQFSIAASGVAVEEKTATLASGKTADGQIIPIIVKVKDKDTGRQRVYRATAGKVMTRWDQMFNTSSVTIQLTGEVHVPGSEAADQKDPSLRKTDWQRGQIPLPKDPVFEQATLGDIYNNPEEFTSDADILKDMQVELSTRPEKIKGEIVAEMHARIAFGVSCMLLVALGAALGIIFKGGQMITAFAISVIPAAAIMVLIMMGKKMISNPESSATAGVIAIWGGILLLLVADTVIYHRLSKS